MTEVTESMIYDMAFRVRLYIASKVADEKRINDLSERETLLIQLIGTTGRMSISEICNYYPRVSNSTISTSITKLWKTKKLVDKNIKHAQRVVRACAAGGELKAFLQTRFSWG